MTLLMFPCMRRSLAHLAPLSVYIAPYLHQSLWDLLVHWRLTIPPHPAIYQSTQSSPPLPSPIGLNLFHPICDWLWMFCFCCSKGLGHRPRLHFSVGGLCCSEPLFKIRVLIIVLIELEINLPLRVTVGVNRWTYSLLPGSNLSYWWCSFVHFLSAVVVFIYLSTFLLPTSSHYSYAYCGGKSIQTEEIWWQCEPEVRFFVI